MITSRFILMSARTIAPLFLVLLSCSLLPAVSINEYWADDAGGDDVEFAELFGAPGETLDGISFLIVDGDTEGDTGSGNFQEVNLQVDLSGRQWPQRF